MLVIKLWENCQMLYASGCVCVMNEVLKSSNIMISRFHKMLLNKNNIYLEWFSPHYSNRTYQMVQSKIIYQILNQIIQWILIIPGFSLITITIAAQSQNNSYISRKLCPTILCVLYKVRLVTVSYQIIGNNARRQSLWPLFDHRLPILWYNWTKQ